MELNREKRSRAPSAKILILEDDFLNAFLIEDTLRLAGHVVVGPAKTVSQALGLLGAEAIDAAILDLQIDNEVSYDVGGRLEELGIPWAITTAHPPSFVGPRFSHIPVLAKPFMVSALLDLTEQLLEVARRPTLRRVSPNTNGN